MSNFILDDLKNTFKRRNNAITQIIIINVAAFIIINIISNFLSEEQFFSFVIWLALPSDIFDFTTHFWTILTYMFLHFDFMHILFNMLWLYWMGKILVEYQGNRSFVSTYILGGISGGILYLISYNIIFPANGILLGASAGVMAVVFAVATLLPEHRIHLLFIGPVRMKYLALGALVITTILDFSANTGGKIAHLGGALYGYIYIKQLQKGKDIARGYYRLVDSIALLFKQQPKRKMKVKYKNKSYKTDEEYNVVRKQKQQRIDDILDKISKSGYDSLSKEEKRFLFEESNRG